MVKDTKSNKDADKQPPSQAPATPPTPSVPPTPPPAEQPPADPPKEPTEKEQRKADNVEFGTSDLTDAEQLDAMRTELADKEGKASKNNPVEVEEAVLAYEAPKGRMLLAGTVLMFADKKVTLAENVFVNYEGEESEAAFVGMCHLTDNLDVNRSTLKFRYDGLGTRLPLAEQVDDQKDLHSFIKSLTVDEAASFGIDEMTWNGYQAA